MQFSIVNGQRLKASPRLIGNCPACGTPTRSKCGSIILWHWAHITTKHCDAWWENESEWHKEWKAQFQEDLQEVVQYDQSTGERHIADIKTNQGLVIELQHSAISIDELRSRESFYQNMVWIVDGRSFKDRFTIFPDRLPAPYTKLHRDFRLNKDGSVYRLISTDWFGTGYSKKYEHEKYQWLLDKSYKGHHFFEWSRPRKIWFSAKKPVFLDFGTESLYELQPYPDYYNYCVQIHSKLDFIQKHST